jgi:hypothetical protein
MVVGAEAVGLHDRRPAVATPYPAKILGFEGRILAEIQQAGFS